jgi:4-hydroxybenzoyl-CoA thioesterase
MGKVFRVEYPIRFSHCDPAGQVYFPRFFDLLHDALEDWFNVGLKERFADFLMTQRLGTPTVPRSATF